MGSDGEQQMKFHLFARHSVPASAAGTALGFRDP